MPVMPASRAGLIATSASRLCCAPVDSAPQDAKSIDRRRRQIQREMLAGRLDGDFAAEHYRGVKRRRPERKRALMVAKARVAAGLTVVALALAWLALPGAADQGFRTGDAGLGVDAETLNRDIRRISPAPGARSRQANPVFAELTGQIKVPVMAIHETEDFRVPFRLQQNYRRRVDAAGAGSLLVQRAVRWAGHCSFDGTVRERAFDDLVAWMERGVAPAGDDVLGDVPKLGLNWTPALHPADPARRQ
jgi:pimeloyl-ACP methyl ester carboxylesterase